MDGDNFFWFIWKYSIQMRDITMRQRHMALPVLWATSRRERVQQGWTIWRLWSVSTVSQTLEAMPTGKAGDRIITMRKLQPFLKGSDKLTLKYYFFHISDFLLNQDDNFKCNRDYNINYFCTPWCFSKSQCFFSYRLFFCFFTEFLRRIFEESHITFFCLMQ